MIQVNRKVYKSIKGEFKTVAGVFVTIWIGRLFTEGASPWKAFINQLLENLVEFFSSGVVTI